MEKNISKYLEMIYQCDYNREKLTKILKNYHGVHLMRQLDYYLSNLLDVEDEMIERDFYQNNDRWLPENRKDWEALERAI